MLPPHPLSFSPGDTNVTNLFALAVYLAKNKLSVNNHTPIYNNVRVCCHSRNLLIHDQILLCI